MFKDITLGLDPRARANPAAEEGFQQPEKRYLLQHCSKHGVAEVKNRLKHALRSAMSTNSDQPDPVTSLALLIRALRADF